MKKPKAKIVSVSYSRLKNRGNYENERVEATAQVGPGGNAADAYLAAKKFVLGQLKIKPVKPKKYNQFRGHGPVCVCDECM